jgi:hypothetical protein
MGPVMSAHVNEFLGFGGPTEGSLAYRSRLSHEGYYRTVGGLSRVYVQYLHPFYGPDGGYNGLNHILIPSFTIIGNAFDELFHGISFIATLKVSIFLHINKPRKLDGFRGLFNYRPSAYY